MTETNRRARYYTVTASGRNRLGLEVRSDDCGHRPYSAGRISKLFESIPLGRHFHRSYLDYLDWKRENSVFQSLDVYALKGILTPRVDNSAYPNCFRNS
ncbi:MAG TPA: hypothetical protein VGM27_25430 [Acidobacteriaceae bacterium]